MKRGFLLAGVSLALTSTVVLAQRAPESILPPGVGGTAPSPTPAPAATSAPSTTSGAAPAPNAAGEVVQPLPTGSTNSGTSSSAPVSTSGIDLSDIPSVAELERMTAGELDELLGLKPKVDIPPAARRSTEQVGVLSPQEGGLPTGSLANQPAALVRAALVETRRPMISRWGHILMRRTLASRLEAPQGMDPVEFAALRVRVLNNLGEFAVARAVVQDVDTPVYTNALLNVALNSYIGTADITGACPAVRLARSGRDDAQWRIFEGICAAYSGETQRAQNDLRRLLKRNDAAQIDVLLAQRFAGAAGEGRRAVTIEWDGIDEMTPLRFGLANALGETLPEKLADDLSPSLLMSEAITPAIPLTQRVRGADLAAASGILSSQAMVDLYSQIYADREQTGENDALPTAARLRTSYTAPSPAERMAALKDIWKGDGDSYGRLVLTAYAAARMTPQGDLADDAGQLIASMLTAGLDRDAMRWADLVDEGSLAWGQIVLANPQDQSVSAGEVDSFVSDDRSKGQRKSQMLVAGLAGLGRMDTAEAEGIAQDLGVPLTAPTAWTAKIDKAAEVNNPALVALLAGLGMQGNSWDQMTARHLYHIVSGLRRVGLEAEARMIAAEAVARA